MTTVASHSRNAETAEVRAAPLGLSGRLIVLTMSFVMLAEILIYIPSALSFRRSWISDRIMGAQMIALALAGTPSESRSTALDAKLLAGVKGAQAIGVRGPGTRWVLAEGEHPPAATFEIDLRQRSQWAAFKGLLRNLFYPSYDSMRIVGPGVPNIEGVEWVEILLDEGPLKQAVLDFTRNFLLVSMVISLFTGALLYLALHMMVVAPVRRLSKNIASFAQSPEDIGRVIQPSGRTDEIGRAEHALARMQTTLAGELRQKRHLADLGLAVSKINHELRNMLTTAQLLGDRLDEVEDPTVRRIAPRLVRTLRRAVDYCTATLAYGRASEPAPMRQLLSVRNVVAEQLDDASLQDGVFITVTTDIPADLKVDADAEQLGRILLNLVRNAVDAHARTKTNDACIHVSAARAGGGVEIRVSDNGPGVPDRIRDRLFSAFQASERSGGTGLGLPVAQELVRLHGGTIMLERSERGTMFVVTVPDRVSASLARA